MSATTLFPRFAGHGVSHRLGKSAPQSGACLDKPRLSMMSRLLHSLQQGLKRRAAIRALGALDERMLADIGIDRDRIEAETDAMLARAERGDD
jgi:uncharacterized protein YjiS (DUF1127 family)